MPGIAVNRREALGVLAAVLVGGCGNARARVSSKGSTIQPSTAPTTARTPASSLSGTTVLVAGSNKNIDHQTLVDDANGYNGRWSGAWKIDTYGTTGSIAGTVMIDPDARRLTAQVTVDGDLLHDGVPVDAFPVDGSVDSYTYGDDGSFSIHKTTMVGDATLTSVGGIGTGQFHLNVTNVHDHPRVSSFETFGVANRGGGIPMTFRVSYVDGTTASGSCKLFPSRA